MKDAVSWLACGLLLPGIYLMGRKQAFGFVLAILANALWIAWCVLVHAWAVVAESCVIALMYARALSTWLAQAQLSQSVKTGSVGKPPSIIQIARMIVAPGIFRSMTAEQRRRVFGSDAEDE